MFLFLFYFREECLLFLAFFATRPEAPGQAAAFVTGQGHTMTDFSFFLGGYFSLLNR